MGTNQTAVVTQANAGGKRSEDLPNLLRKTMKIYGQIKPSEKPGEEAIKLKKQKHSGHGGPIKIDEDTERYLARELQMIHTPYCNFSNSFSTILHYQNILGYFYSLTYYSVPFHKMTPLKLQV